ncbi:MAG TPA: hypothetical protein VMZ26_18090 [Pyrinomonadaceae bacterium]|nr:hypothetical protein [Pyrinomonadaceae bacterium]
MKIVDYVEKTHYEMLRAWWTFQREVPPTPGMVPEGSTWIVYAHSGVPLISASVLLTNSCVAYAENFVGNPFARGEFRKEATDLLIRHGTEFARRANKTKLVCLAPNATLAAYYEKLGFVPTLKGLFGFVKEIS